MADKTPANKISAITKTLLNAKHVYNRYETIDYTVPTGSLALDVMTGGGFHPGVVRFVGQSMGGKTSEAFQVMQNVFQIRPRSRGIYIKTERLSKKTERRIGVKVVKSEEDWVNHTCLMVECSIYETVSQFIIDLIMANIELPEEEREQFVFIIDSLDFLILEADFEKSASEAFKVAGPQVITKKLMAKIIVPLAKFGHFGLFISQATAQPKIDPYAKVIPRIAGDISGGNAIVHAADHILEFMARNQGDYILEDPKAKPDGKSNKTLGHYVKIVFRKSDNEKYNQKVQYPIKYARTNGQSIWIERETVDKVIEYGLLNKKGSWFEIPESYRDELASEGLPAQIQGMNKLYDIFEEKPRVCKFFYDKLMMVLTEDDLAIKEEDAE